MIKNQSQTFYDEVNFTTICFWRKLYEGISLRHDPKLHQSLVLSNVQ